MRSSIKARPPAVGDEPPRPVDLAEKEGCYQALLLVRVEAAVLGGSLFFCVKETNTLYVLTSANLVPCPHQPLVAWAMIKEQFTAFCLFLLPWLGPLVYRDGVTPPLNPGRPPERAGESTRIPLISPEKLALPRPARGAPLASSLAGFFRETGGQWGPHPRTSPCAAVWPTAPACGFFASEKSKP